MRLLPSLFVILVLLFPISTPGASEEEFSPARLEAMDAAVNAAIVNHEIPGAVIWIERGDEHFVVAEVLAKSGWACF